MRRIPLGLSSFAPRCTVWILQGQRQRRRTVISFKTIRARAEQRKGGARELQRLLPPRPDPKTLHRLGATACSPK